jgi:hypothetical protein
MANELLIQREIKQSVINAGGYAVKLSNRFTIGIPDLGVWLAPFVPTIFEVKDLGECVAKFDRQLDVTPKQKDVMRRMQKSYDRPAGSYGNVCVTGTLVHIRHRGRRVLVALPYDAPRLAWDYEEQGLGWIERGSGGRWNMGKLMQGLGVSYVA